jgi:LEA14-like dessication related protein
MTPTRSIDSVVRLRPLALLLAAVLLSVGCSTATPPRFNVLGVAERERTDEAVVLDFTIGAENRNEDALPLERATYTLSLDGQRVFEGQRLARVTIPRFGEQRLVLPVVVPADLVPVARFDGGGEMRYRLDGEIEFQTPGRLAEFLFDVNLRRPTAPLGLRGVLELEDG